MTMSTSARNRSPSEQANLRQEWRSLFLGPEPAAVSGWEKWGVALRTILTLIVQHLGDSLQS